MFFSINSFIHSFIQDISTAPLQVHYTQRRARHSTDSVPEFNAVLPQATVSEGLAQGPYVESTNAAHHAPSILQTVLKDNLYLKVFIVIIDFYGVDFMRSRSNA